VLTDKRIRAVIIVAAIVWAVLLVAQGADVDVSFFKPFSTVVGVTILVLAAFDRWLWRWWPFRLLQKQPIVSGTWKGTFTSNYDAGAGTAPPTEAYLVVRQTASTISFTLLTAESSSHTVAATMEQVDGHFVMSGTYVNTPRALIQERSRPSRGSASIDVHNGQHLFLEGAYWTDRGTKGELRFDGRADPVVTHFDIAQSLFS
jgi:hypothetical protein